MSFVSQYQFQKCVDRYQGDYKIQSFTCWEQFLSMAFAQLTYRESLRDIEACLRSCGSKLYHMGIRSSVSRNNLAHANEVRDWHIYADFAQVLIAEARELYRGEDFGLELANTAYALDASVIDLCLKLFPWAKFRRTKGAVKMHTLLDLRGNIPSFLHISTGKVADVNILDDLLIEAGAFYIMDRGYLDFERLYLIKEALAFFVIREKSNTCCRPVAWREVDKTTGLRCDQSIVLTKSFKKYPERLRRVRYFDEETDKSLVFLSNNFSIEALLVAQLYRLRWQVELFFRWIKQHLRIKAFYGTSENAVKTQIWISISIYVLVAIVKKRTGVPMSLYQMLQILSVTLFEKMPILQALQGNFVEERKIETPNQLILFG
jgi:hypothetical protein